MREYLDSLRRGRLIPNFWMSAEWAEACRWRERTAGRTVWVEDDEGRLLFPPVRDGQWVREEGEVWADHVFVREGFLDDNFIYRSEDFQNLRGRRWRAFRKNLYKWLERDWDYCEASTADFREVLEAWASWMEGREFWGLEEMLRFEGEWACLRVEGKPMGLNGWDRNHFFVNYRFALTRDRSPGLSEMLRWCFYTRTVRRGLVNDGGWLGRPGLKRFKQKLNPVGIIRVYSGKYQQQEGRL